jgi:hypothetical protein
MRRSSLLPLAAALTALTAVAGCADAPTATSRAPELLASRAAATAVQRPFQGRCDVEATFTGPTTVVWRGTCQLAHLGRTTVVSHETISFETFSTATTSTYTAANGDLLYTTGTAAVTPGPEGSFAAAGPTIVVGGTGRFAHASGEAAFADAGHPTGPTTAVASYTLDGWLAY